MRSPATHLFWCLQPLETLQQHSKTKAQCCYQSALSSQKLQKRMHHQWTITLFSVYYASTLSVPNFCPPNWGQPWVRSVVECHFYSSIIGHNVIHRDVGHTLGWFHLYFKIYEKAEYWPEQIVHGEKNLNVKLRSQMQEGNRLTSSQVVKWEKVIWRSR